jgi:hypothetical protein
VFQTAFSKAGPILSEWADFEGEGEGQSEDGDPLDQFLAEGLGQRNPDEAHADSGFAD